MRKHLRRCGFGALAVGTVAGVAAFALPGLEPGWHPQTYGLTETPAQLLPDNVSTANPVRVVSTALDPAGRPVVTVRTATDEGTATKLVKDGQTADNALGVEIDAPMSVLGVPTGSDPYRTQQWDLGKIRTGDAWQKSTGAGVTVAVIDTGVDATHPDLAGQVLPGYDFITGTAGTSTDPNGHGTHVSGTIAALTGNGVGVASVAPDTKILPVRVLGADGSGYMSDAASGIIWAADHGANVINMSLGSTSKVAAVSNAIAYARGKGVTVVAAAGNSRSSGSPTSYPAADEGVIAVAATDSSDAVASYSNQGSYVDVAAPGSSILSTVPVAKGSYAIYNGTSMASPHVAAVAALLESYNPALTPDQVEKALESTAVDLGAAGKDSDFGYGRIDAASALNAVATTAPAPTTPVTTAPTTTAPTQAPTTAPTTTPPTTRPAEPSKPTTAPTTTPPTTTPPTTKPPTTKPTIAPTTPAPTPSKTTPPVKARPVITVVAPPAEVAYGTATTTTFTVSAGDTPWAARPVNVCLAEGTSGAFKCTSTVTGATGSVAVPRAATGSFRLQMQIAASDATVAVSSQVVTVAVRAAVTVVRTGNTMAVTIDGAVGQSAQVQRLDGGRWLPALTFKAAPRATVTGLMTGRSYRVVVSDTTTILGATSATV